MAVGQPVAAAEGEQDGPPGPVRVAGAAAAAVGADDEPPAAEAEAARVKQSLARSRPPGPDAWTARTAARLGLGWTLRPRGRPPKEKRAT